MDGENEKTDKPEANIPPKLDLKQAVTPPKKATTRIDMAAAAMIPEEKSKTTRINLGAFGPESGVPKTIKIQRPSEASTIKLNRPPAAPSAPSAAPAPAPAAPPYNQAQTKRQTSRISLQEAFIAPAEGQAAAPADVQPAPPGPKTIRIKRPGDTTGASARPPEAAAPAAPAPAAAPASEAATEAGPPTQRKTIKLRRPGGAEGETRPSMTLPKAAADFAAAQAAGPDSSEDEPGATFAILSLVAVLVCGVMIYMLCAQALPTLGLSWTGQVPTLH